MRRKRMPLLTVVVPTYNRADHVRRCLAGLQQSGIDDLGIVVADDGSTDETAEVVSQVDSHAKYVWQPNSGTPATARNRGVGVYGGEYVAFLDCDDQWLPEAPGKALALLERHPEVDVLFADALVGNEDDGFVSWIASAGQEPFFKLPANEPEPGLRVFERETFFRRVAVRNPIFIGACLIRRRVFEESGGFDPGLCGAADWELWLRLAHQYTFGFWSAPMAVYTRHSDNMSENHDHMIGEFCQSLLNVLAKCALDPQDRLFIAERLRNQLFDHAYLAYDDGRLAEARMRFRRCFGAGRVDARSLALWCLAWLPAGLVRRFRSFKQSLGV